MLVVSDTGPIHYLTLIGHVEKLPVLYGSVAIPQAVATELSHQNTPQAIRSLIAARPAWLALHGAPPAVSGMDNLGPGERQAIALSMQLRADLMLCDDAQARSAAKNRQINVVGTLGVLRDAALRRLLDI